MNTITRMWLHIMKSGAIFADEDQEDDDARFWISHQKEITFAFGVLFGLGLVKDDIQGDGTAWLPTARMRRLYQKHFDWNEAADLQAKIETLSKKLKTK